MLQPGTIRSKVRNAYEMAHTTTVRSGECVESEFTLESNVPKGREHKTNDREI